MNHNMSFPAQAESIVSETLAQRLREMANGSYFSDGPGGRTWIDPEELTDEDLRVTADDMAAIENPETRQAAILELLTTHRLLARNNNKLAREFLKFLDAAAAPGCDR
jgi:hypothetical protein